MATVVRASLAKGRAKKTAVTSNVSNVTRKRWKCMGKGRRKCDFSGIEFWLSMIVIALLCSQLQMCMGFHSIESEIRMLRYK